MRWSRAAGLHLTIHFFGPLQRDRLSVMLEVVRPAAAAHRPFELSFDSTGCFPGYGAPRVLWLGTGAGSAALGTLAAGCRGALEAVGVEVEQRPYAAHCTLGRPLRRWPAARRAEWLARPVAVPPFEARRLVLFESVGAPGGAIYTPRGEVMLGG